VQTERAEEIVDKRLHTYRKATFYAHPSNKEANNSNLFASTALVT
jgi:DNA polymerase IIIc chi subunit